MSSAHPILFFDGVCNLCNGAVQWFITRDKQGVLRFASLQSDLGQELLPAAGVDPTSLSSLVLLEDGKAYTKSGGALRAAAHLGGSWKALAKTMFIFPSFLRDGVYDFIARNRYRWFGKEEACMLPRPEWKARFVG
ncbi:MAG: thiol-disulfide oxidoreductase DCC family protein [Bacteroidota bacterium]